MDQLKELLLKQSFLDKRISEYESTKNTWDSKILALLVEIGELANEIPYFKYWKRKKKFNYSKITEEYADVLHFLLSLANDANVNLYMDVFKNYVNLTVVEVDKEVKKMFRFERIERNKENKGKVVNKMLLLFFLISRLPLYRKEKEKQCEILGIVFNVFFSLGKVIKVNQKEIVDSYFKKNEVNHLRLDKQFVSS